MSLFSSNRVSHSPQVTRLGASGPNLTSAIAAAAASGRRLAVLHIDIDGLGTIYASMGERAGDEAMAVIGRRLAQATADSALLWRLGSDEFIAAVAYQPGTPGGEALAERMREAMNAPISVPPHAVAASLSIGIAIYPIHAHDAGELLAAAEQALRRAKRSGRGGQALFSLASPAGADRDVTDVRVEDAIAQSEFRLYYQPVVSAVDGSITSCSTLLRWHNNEEGVLRANRVLPEVKRAGADKRVGLWTIDTAVAQLQQWRRQAMPEFTLSVPLDASVLTGHDCVERVTGILERHKLEPRCIEFEVSEVALSLDASIVSENLLALRSTGSLLTVADFGMGGLSLAALAQYPLDRLKIDRSLLRNVASEPRRAALVRGIIAMGHRLGMTVVGKGVETEAELAFLRRNLCDLVQGYFFCPPLPSVDIEPLMRTRVMRPELFRDGDTQPAARTLLLLDDEENVLRALTRLFRHDGYRLLVANRVSEAFNLLAINDVQVIVSDQRMPDMSGTDFLGRVREMYPDTIRMVLSGFTDVDTITEALNRGAAYRFLTKPWRDEDLREHVRAAFQTAEERRRGRMRS